MRHGKIYICMLAAAVLLASGAVLGDEADKPLESHVERLSYAIGMQIGESLKENGLDLDIEALVRGLRDVYTGSEVLLGEPDMQEIQRRLVAEREEERSRLVGENLRKSREFLEENRQRDGVTVTESGLQYEIIEEGDGRIPGPEASVEIHYVGSLTDGEVFDSSRARGQSITFPLDGIVPGLSEGIMLMQEGASYRFFLPPELAYGERGAGEMIGPNAALIFEVELIEVIE